jgi:DNA-binding NarL/FixJ family response regulator
MTDDNAGLSESSTRSEKLKVLLVDDEESIRMLLRIALERDGGFEIVGEAEDGMEALPMALQHRPDYVILDYSMPRMNGEEAARVLRKVHNDICILAFSAIIEELPPWADAFLSKDRFGEVVQTLKELDRDRCGTEAG